MIRFDKSSLKNFSNLINNYHCHYHRLNHRFYKFPLIQSNNPSSIIILLSSNKKRSYTSIQTFFKPSSKKEGQQQQIECELNNAKKLFEKAVENLEKWGEGKY